MRASSPLILALALALGACAAHNPPPDAADLAGVGASGGRRCFDALTPTRLPDAATLLRLHTLLTDLAARDAGRGATLLSLRFDARGRPTRTQVLVAGAGYLPSLAVRDAVRRALRIQPERRPWGARLRITTGDSVVVTIHRQDVCPVEPLNGRIAATFTDADGATGARPAFGLTSGVANDYDAAGRQRLHARVHLDAGGHVTSATLVDPAAGSDGPGVEADLSPRGTLGWLYDLSFRPLLYDGIPAAAWVDIWFYGQKQGPSRVPNGGAGD